MNPDPKSPQPMLGTCNKWKVLHERGDHLACSDWEPLLPSSGPATTPRLTRWEADFAKEPYMRVSENGEWVRFADLQTLAEPPFPIDRTDEWEARQDAGRQVEAAPCGHEYPLLNQECPECNGDHRISTNLERKNELLIQTIESLRAASVPQAAPEAKLGFREWLCQGGAGHEDGEDGIRACTLPLNSAIEMVDDYLEYLREPERRKAIDGEGK